MTATGIHCQICELYDTNAMSKVKWMREEWMPIKKNTQVDCLTGMEYYDKYLNRYGNVVEK
jgi:hypothetical protein